MEHVLIIIACIGAAVAVTWVFNWLVAPLRDDAGRQEEEARDATRGPNSTPTRETDP